MWGFGEREKGSRFAYLSWSGAPSKGCDIYRDGEKIATVYNVENYTDELGKGGNKTFLYKTCAESTETCTNETSISF